MRPAPIQAELVPCASLPGELPSPGAPLRIGYSQGHTLAQAVYLSGLFIPPALCSGLAVCGKCRLRIVDRAEALPPQAADRECFSREELDRGWRLGCRHAPAPGLRVELPPEAQLRLPRPAPPPPGTAPDGKHLGERVFLAVDLGTTSLQWRIFSLPWRKAGGKPVSPSSAADSGPEQTPPLAIRILDQGSMVNPQMGAGSDVMSRLAFARQDSGAERLRRLTLDAIGDIIRGNGPERPVHALCLAANPAMTAIAIGLDVTGLSRAPYTLPFSGGVWARLPDLPGAWIPPQLSPFVGGDISAGYAALARQTLLNGRASSKPVFPFLLADMGTNGEFLLALSPDKALAASVALGPALEGVGLSHGAEARPSAVTDFNLGPQGLTAMWAAGAASPVPPGGEAFSGPAERVVSAPVPARAQPSGISGTGYIALLHLLRQCGALEEDGRFSSPGSPLLRRLLQPRTDPARRQAFLPLPNGFRLYASDVEEILKVKAAFSLGLHRLLTTAALATKDLAAVYIAGSLGRHVRMEALEGLGFFPPGLQSRITAVGNASLAGATLLLGSKKLRAALTAWAARVHTLDLANDAAFVRNYASAMRFSWQTEEAGEATVPTARPSG